jgi:hypothetical protein
VTIRLRVTDLDAWVRFLEPEREEFEVSLDDFLAQMRREAPETPAMRAGQAFHSLMEKAHTGQVLDGGLAGIEQDGFWFHFHGDFEVSVPRAREEPVGRVYQTPAGAVLLRGKVDASDPITVTDYKLTFGQFDAERYAASLQWRAYLHITGARRFHYVVFQAMLDESDMSSDVFVFDMHNLAFFAYPEMGEHVTQRVSELAAFVADHVPTLVEVTA